MRKNPILTAIAFAALAFVGCSQDDVLSESSSVGKPIEFGTYLGRPALTKTGESSGTTETTTSSIQQEGKGFGVLAYYTGTNAWTVAQSSATPNFMYNQHITYNSGAWTYAPLKYWPTNTNDKISFFAYAPYTVSSAVSAVIKISANTAQNTPTVTYTIPDNVADMVDFVADVIIDKSHNQQFSTENVNGSTVNTTESNKVKFNLNHELSRIGFSAKVDEKVQVSSDLPTRVVVTGLELSSTNGMSYKSALYTFANENDENNGGTTAIKRGIWTAVSNSAEKIKNLDIATILDKKDHSAANFLTEITSDNDLNAIQGIWLTLDATANTKLLKANDYLYLIPLNPGSGSSYFSDVTAKISYSIITADNNLDKKYSLTNDTKTVELGSSIVLEQGKAINFNFVIGIDEIKVEATVANWDTETSNDIKVDYQNGTSTAGGTAGN